MGGRQGRREWLPADNRHRAGHEHHAVEFGVRGHALDVDEHARLESCGEGRGVGRNHAVAAGEFLCEPDASGVVLHGEVLVVMPGDHGPDMNHAAFVGLGLGERLDVGDGCRLAGRDGIGSRSHDRQPSHEQHTSGQ